MVGKTPSNKPPPSSQPGEAPTLGQRLRAGSSLISQVKCNARPCTNNSHYGPVTPRRVRAPGLQTLRKRPLVGRVPSSGVPISSILRIADPIRVQLDNPTSDQAVFAFRVSAFLRSSVFGLRISRGPSVSSLPNPARALRGRSVIIGFCQPIVPMESPWNSHGTPMEHRHCSGATRVRQEDGPGPSTADPMRL